MLLAWCKLDEILCRSWHSASIPLASIAPRQDTTRTSSCGRCTASAITMLSWGATSKLCFRCCTCRRMRVSSNSTMACDFLKACLSIRYLHRLFGGGVYLCSLRMFRTTKSQCLYPLLVFEGKILPQIFTRRSCSCNGLRIMSIYGVALQTRWSCCGMPKLGSVWRSLLVTGMWLSGAHVPPDWLEGVARSVVCGHICACSCVFLCVCMYVCMYLCMYVCMWELGRRTYLPTSKRIYACVCSGRDVSILLLCVCVCLCCNVCTTFICTGITYLHACDTHITATHLFGATKPACTQ